MTPPLFLIDVVPEVPSTGAGVVIELTGEQGRHARVRRLGVGETLWLSDGRGSLGEGAVEAVLAYGVRVRIVSRRTQPRAVPGLVVVQALAKGDRSELAVETMTELGVDVIVPWTAARSIVEWRDERGARALDRWRRVAAEAAKQSRRPWVPEVTGPATTAQVADRIRSAAAFVLHEAATVALAGVRLPGAEQLLLVVGPEGGIDDAERAEFEAAGAVSVRLGTPVLRTSTAGAAALAALSVRLGRWA